jgi:bifunctional non-homologous end joining protein LigD
MSFWVIRAISPSPACRLLREARGTPLNERVAHDRAHGWARGLAGEMTEWDLRHSTLPAQENRHGRTFLDNLRNGRGTTAVGTYSPRVRQGFQ